ncbi:NAD(P)H-dependent FMN reductase/rhodanese-related sulfurtransferase [Rhodococcus sp. 27YEA15]|uniref:NAD(P)H-dependent oxidoreductase n=1 Tax=Rhodococcus sp. 27YEA15 TaxID=3156259 RepID=UPI003C7CF879
MLDHVPRAPVMLTSEVLVSLIALLVGSRSADSPARALAEFVAESLETSGHTTFLVDAAAVSATALLDGDTTDRTVDDLVTVADAADAVVVLSPVVKAGYSGTTRSLLELLPENAFAGKSVLALSAGTAPTGIDDNRRAIEPIIRSLSGDIVGPGVHVCVYDITRNACSVALDGAAHQMVEDALGHLQSGLVVDGANGAADSAAQLLDAGDALESVRAGALLVDVRSNPTLGVGLIAGAVHVQKSDVEAVFGNHGSESRPLVGIDRAVVVVCNSERGSSEFARTLVRLGYRQVSHIRGGAAALASELRMGPVSEGAGALG